MQPVLDPRTRARSGVAAAALVVALGGCGSHGTTSSARASEGTEPAPIAMPATATVEGREIPDTLVLDATLLADEESQVTPIVAGRVVEVLVERGDRVEAGDPIVRLRDTDYRLQARTARASLAASAARLGIEPDDAAPAADATPEVRSAAAEVTVAEESLRRAEDLAGRGVFSAQQLDDARARAERARDAYATAVNAARASIATLESARATLSTASTALRETTVTAPFAGEIAERSVSVGEYVALATALVTLVRTDPIRVEMLVPQERLGDVHVGQVVRLSVDAFEGRTFEGTVRYLSASVRRESRGMVVEAVIPNAEGTLRPGMFGRVTIELGHTRPITVVPETAVLTEAGVSRAFVIVTAPTGERSIEERVLDVVSREGAEVRIREGLAAGDVVASERLSELGDGLRIGG